MYPQFLAFSSRESGWQSWLIALHINQGWRFGAVSLKCGLDPRQRSSRLYGSASETVTLL